MIIHGMIIPYSLRKNSTKGESSCQALHVACAHGRHDSIKVDRARGEKSPTGLVGTH